MKDKTPHEVLTSFLQLLMKESPLFSEAKRHLTLTQQESCKIVGLTNTEGVINGLFSLLKQTETYKIKENHQTNKTVCDFSVTLNLKTRFLGKSYKAKIRLIKEIEPRKPSIYGVWGININSFKIIEKK